MAYNKRNYYTRIIEIQDLVLECKRKDPDRFYKEIYWQEVFPKYRISYRTFSSYLGINAKRELKLLEEKQNKQTKTLFDI